MKIISAYLEGSNISNLVLRLYFKNSKLFLYVSLISVGSEMVTSENRE